MVQSKGVTSVQLCVFTGAQALLVCKHLEFKIIIPKSVQHIDIIFVGEVFQIEISDGLVHPLGVVKF